MSVKVSSWVWSLETLTDNAPLLVLLALADAANDEGYCWHNQKTLCKKSRQSTSTARRALRKLEAMGLVTTFRRMTSKGLASNLYLLNVGAEPDHTLQSDQSVTLNVPDGATIDEVIAEVERYRLSRVIPRPVKMTGGGSGQNDRGVPGGVTFPRDSATGQNDRRGHDDRRGAVTHDGTPRSQVTGPYKEEPSYEPSLMNQTLPNPPQSQSDPVGSGAIQDDLSAQAGLPGSADADAEAAMVRGELAAEMLASGENPASLVAEGWWNAGQLAEALAWAAEHPAPARAPETTQQRQEVASQAVRREHEHVDEASALIGACLPEWMQAMDRTGARQVAGMLAERIAAGWTPAQIRSLMGEKPANGVRRMSSLAAYRLDQNAGIADAPKARAAAARQVQEAAIDAAHQAQAAAIDAARTPEERAREAAYSQMWDRMRAAHPQASKVELVALVRDAFAAQGTALV